MQHGMREGGCIGLFGVCLLMGLNIHVEFSTAKISELPHKPANSMHTGSLSCCERAARQRVSTCVTLHTLHLAKAPPNSNEGVGEEVGQDSGRDGLCLISAL